MALLSAPPTSPFLVVAILVLSSVSFPLVVAIWIIQARDGRRHYALSFMVFWLLVVALLGILEQTLLQPGTFPFSLFNSHNPQTSANVRIATVFTQSPIPGPSSNISFFATSDSLSGWTAMALVQSWHSYRPDSEPLTQDPPVLRLCIFLAHVSEIQWFGVCISLAKWTWYLHRCLSRKLSIVDLRRQVAGEIAGDVTGIADLASTEDKDGQSTAAASTSTDRESFGTRNVISQYNTAAAQATAARFHVQRPIRSLDDLRDRLPVVTTARLLLAILLVRDAIADCICCCRGRKRKPSRTLSDHEQPVGSNHDAWVQWSSICDEEIARTAYVTKGRKKRLPFANGPATLLPPLCEERDDYLAGQVNSGIPTSIEQATRNVTLDHLTSSLATKTQVPIGDCDVDLDERFGYDISGRHIRFEKGSWLHQFKLRLFSNVALLVDLFICIGIPIALFLLRLLIKVNGRSYDVYSERGGCRISRSSGRTDWTVTLIMEAITTVVALISIVLAALSLYKFRAQSGTFNIDVKTLTPSAKILRLYKATKVVRHLLILCFILNAMFTVARVVHFGLLNFNPTIIYLNRDLDQQNIQTQTARGPRSPLPLFRVADRDRDVVCSIVSPMAMVVLFTILSWTRLERWSKDFFCCCWGSRRQHDQRGSPTEGPSVMKGAGASEPLSPSHSQSAEKKETFAHPAFEAVWGVDEVLTQRMANRKHLLRFLGSGPKEPIQSTVVVDSEQGYRATGGLIERDDIHELETTAVLDTPLHSRPSKKDTCSTLDIDRPSEDTFNSGDGLLSVSIPETGLETISKRACHPPNVKSIKSPSGRIRYDPSWLPSPPVHGRPSSPRMMVGGKAVGFGVSPNNNRVGHQDNLPMVPITTTSIPQTAAFAPSENNSSFKDTPTIRAEISAFPLPPTWETPRSEIAEAGTGYDRVLKKLAKKKKRDSSRHGKKIVVYPRSTNFSRDFHASGSEVDGDVGDECEIVTMGSISLDGLFLDEPNATEYDFMYQKMMVESLAQNMATAAMCRPSGGRGRRRSSVIRFASTSPGGVMSQGRLSRDHCAINPSFHLVSAIVNQERSSSDLCENGQGELLKIARVPPYSGPLGVKENGQCG